MHDAELDLRLRVKRLDGFRKAFQPVHTSNEDVLYAAILQLAEHLQPEFGTFVLSNPHPQELLVTIQGDGQRQVDRFIVNVPVVAHLKPDRIQVQDRIDRLQRPRLPALDLIQDGIGHVGDQTGRELDPVQRLQLGLNVACTQAACLQRHDLLVKTGQPTLAIGHQQRFIAASTVARNLNW